MKRNTISGIVALLFLSIGCIAQQLPDGVKKFTVAEIETRRDPSKPWNGFLNETSMSTGIYKMNPDQKDEQTPHRLDEIYIILEGESTLQAGDKKMAAKPGSIFYVRAEISHYFFDHKGSLKVLVLFPKAKTNPKDISEAQYQLADVAKNKKSGENYWNPFFKCSTMDFGLYSLPKKLNGDKDRTAELDELLFITKGSGKLTIENVTVDVAKDDIFYIQKGKSYHFHDLKDDVEILKMLAKPVS